MLRASLAHKSEEETSVTVRRFLRQSNWIASAWFNEKRGSNCLPSPPLMGSLFEWGSILARTLWLMEREEEIEEMVLYMHSFSFLSFDTYSRMAALVTGDWWVVAMVKALIRMVRKEKNDRQASCVAGQSTILTQRRLEEARGKKRKEKKERATLAAPSNNKGERGQMKIEISA